MEILLIQAHCSFHFSVVLANDFTICPPLYYHLNILECGYWQTALVALMCACRCVCVSGSPAELQHVKLGITAGVSSPAPHGCVAQLHSFSITHLPTGSGLTWLPTFSTLSPSPHSDAHNIPVLSLSLRLCLYNSFTQVVSLLALPSFHCFVPCLYPFVAFYFAYY